MVPRNVVTHVERRLEGYFQVLSKEGTGFVVGSGLQEATTRMTTQLGSCLSHILLCQRINCRRKPPPTLG